MNKTKKQVSSKDERYAFDLSKLNDKEQRFTSSKKEVIYFENFILFISLFVLLSTQYLVLAEVLM